MAPNLLHTIQLLVYGTSKDKIYNLAALFSKSLQSFLHSNAFEA